MKDKPERIQTARLVLRPITEEDWPDMRALLYDEEIKKTYMIPDFPAEEDALRLFRRFRDLSRETRRFVFGADCQGRLIGFLNDVHMENDAIEVGYVIHPARQNQGYATEMLRAAIRALFDMGFGTVRAGFFEDNIPSRRVMEKSGMHATGKTEEIEYRGIRRRCVYFEIILFSN